VNETTQSFSFAPKRGARVLVSAPDWQPGSEIVSAVKADAPTAVVIVAQFPRDD
jgi:hypothetical protein